MKELVELILQNSKKIQKDTTNPKQIFYREFDLLLKLARRRKLNGSEQIERLEVFGLAAGIPTDELAYRKKTILWALA